MPSRIASFGHVAIALFIVRRAFAHANAVNTRLLSTRRFGSPCASRTKLGLIARTALGPLKTIRLLECINAQHRIARPRNDAAKQHQNDS
jgi:hypothetical protein